MSHHLEYFQKILDFTVLRVDARNNTLQIRKTFGNFHEFSLESGMTHEVFYSVKSEKNLHFVEPLYQMQGNLPSVDIRDTTQGHAQPDAEQPLS